MAIIYPRAYVALSTSVNGEQVDTGIEPTKASFTRRSHNQAGTAEITIHGSALPFDPQTVQGIFITLFMADVDRVDGDVRDKNFIRFVGFVDDMHETRDENGPAVELKARDLSALYRDFKPVPTDAIPHYSDTIYDAVNALINSCPNTFEAGASNVPRVTVRPTDPNPTLAEAAHARAQATAVQLPRELTCWGAIEHCAGLVNKLVFMDLQEVVLANPPEAINDHSAPVASFVFGEDSANVLKVERERKFVRNRKGVLVTSYDPVNRVTLQAVYPSDADLPPSHRPLTRAGNAAIRTQRPTRRRSASAARPPDRDAYAAPNGIQTQNALDKYAQRLYVERARQEIEGKLVVPWGDNTNDLLALKNSDRFTLRVNPALEAEIRNTQSDQRAIDMLTRRLLVNEQAARVLVQAARSHQREVPFYTRSVTHEYTAEGDCSSTIEFINLLDIT